MDVRRKPIAWVREGSCIRCTSHALRCGYPIMKRNGECRTIARFILMKRIGGIPNGIVARHSCDNNWCIRPDHIVPGTHSDNIRDRNERGRTARGEKSGNAKLTNLQVQQIREAAGTQTEIAKRFGVSQQLVSRIRLKDCWRHL